MEGRTTPEKPPVFVVEDSEASEAEPTHRSEKGGGKWIVEKALEGLMENESDDASYKDESVDEMSEADLGIVRAPAPRTGAKSDRPLRQGRPAGSTAAHDSNAGFSFQHDLAFSAPATSTTPSRSSKAVPRSTPPPRGIPAPATPAYTASEVIHRFLPASRLAPRPPSPSRPNLAFYPPHQAYNPPDSPIPVRKRSFIESMRDKIRYWLVVLLVAASVAGTLSALGYTGYVVLGVRYQGNELAEYAPFSYVTFSY